MYITPEPYFQNLLGTDVRPCQNNLDTEEDLFLCQYAKTLVYKRQRLLGMLYLYATPFYPPMDIKTEVATNIRTECIAPSTNSKTSKDKENNNKTIQDQKLQESKDEARNIAETDNKNIENQTEQRKYKNVKISLHKKETNNEETKQNQYAVLIEIEDTIEETETVFQNKNDNKKEVVETKKEE